MNKQELRRLVKEFQKEHGIDLYDCYITHGGALVLNGLIDETADIDLRAKETIWRKMITKGFPMETLPATGTKPETKQLTVAENITMQLAPRDDSFADIILENGLAFTNPSMTLAHYRQLNRPKDQERITLLSNLLES